MNTLELFTEACLKHLQGMHNQKRHGYRYGSVDAARRSMRGVVNADERAEYRKRAGMPTPVKRAKVEEKPKPINKIGNYLDMGGIQSLEINGKRFTVAHLGTGKFTKNLTELRDYSVRVAPDYNSSGATYIRAASMAALIKKLGKLPYNIVAPQGK